MMRRCFLRLDGAASKKTIFAMRKNPKNLFQKGMHSSLLTDHPLTQKAAHDELMYKQRVLAERGQGPEAAREFEKTIELTGQKPSGAREFYILAAVAGAGYLFGHFFIFHLFYDEEVRLPYDPVKGFAEDIREKKKEMAKVDDFWNSQIASSIKHAPMDQPSEATEGDSPPVMEASIEENSNVELSPQ